MSRKGNFSGELQAIATAVEGDVGRVISLLRQDENADAPAKHGQRLRAPSQPTRTADTQPPIEPAAIDARQVLENVTTRLTQRTNELLTEAALRQKLAKAKPDTRQDIVEEAIREWLVANGYG